MEPHLICVVTPGLCRCGFVSDTAISGGLVCPHCCHETAVTANGEEGELYREWVKPLLQIKLQHCSLISNHDFFNCMGCFFYFLQSPSSVTPSPPGRGQDRAGLSAGQLPSRLPCPALAAAHAGKDLQELWPTANIAGPRQILLSQTLPPAPRHAHSHPASPTAAACLFATGEGEKQRQLLAAAI